MITVYSRPDCVQCHYTMRELDKRGIDYTEVELTAELADQFRAQGYTTAPIVHNHATGETWAGFRIEKLRGLRGSKVQA